MVVYVIDSSAVNALGFDVTVLEAEEEVEEEEYEDETSDSSEEATE